MKLLVVVDMQNDFITGSLGTKEAQEIVPKVKAKIDECNENGDIIVFTMDTHTPDYLKTQEGKNLPVKHCEYNTNGWMVVDTLVKSANNAPLSAPTQLLKNTFGCEKLIDYLEDRICYLDEIELVGVCTGICVISNALLIKSFYPEIKITVDASCCACVASKSHKTALDAMKMCQINVIGE